MTATQKITGIEWTTHTARCVECRERFRIGEMAIQAQMEGFDAAITRQEAIERIEWCLECITGQEHEGEKP